MARPTTKELRKKRIRRSDNTIQDKVVDAAPLAIEKAIEILHDATASHNAALSAADKVLREFRRYQEAIQDEPDEEDTSNSATKQDTDKPKSDSENDLGEIDLGF